MPPLTSTEAMVHVAVLRRLLGGASVDPAALSAATGLTLVRVGGALERLHAEGTIFLSDGIVIAAYPFSAVPTRHRILCEGTTSYACCAIDALAVSSMMDSPATVESRCARCDREVGVRMRGGRVLACHPAVPVVFYVHRDCCEAGPTVLVRCPHINFFCESGHADRWLAQNRRLAGDTLTLDQGVIRAREIFASAISLVQGARTGDSSRA